MSLQLDQTVLAGNLTRDPQVRMIANGQCVADFAIAINRRWKASDGTMKEKACFIDCVAWGKTAEHLGRYFTKGMGILVEGRHDLDQWEDARDGGKRYKLRVVADRIHFTDSKKPGAPTATAQPETVAAPPAAPQSGPSAAAGDDEPPF
jgi:single-strand DNA-binding protein